MKRQTSVEPNRNLIAVAEAELRAQVRLAEELDLVGRISAFSRLDGLKGEPAIAPADSNGCKE